MIANPASLVHNARVYCFSFSNTLTDQQAYIEILTAAWLKAHPTLPPGEAVICIRTVVDLTTGLPEQRIFIESKTDLEQKYAKFG